ncbi:MAG TPA: amidohydrolase family protein, partial [Polyangiaceae bacterium]|nr:amidohydrolase family protein [Polyangiaceae bacterium]
MNHDETGGRAGAPRDARSALGRRGRLQSAWAGATLAAAGAALGSAGCAEEGEPSGGARSDIEGAVKRIDTHHHVLPPKVKEWMVNEGLLPPTGGPPWATWSLEATLEMMDAHGIQAGVVSQPAPSDIFLDRARAEAGVRIVNEAAAELAARHPTRFGFFAYLPLAHVDLALQAAAYAFDQLGADGALLMNHVQNRYLGDPAFEPLFAELDRRGAVVMTHPDSLPTGGGGFELSPALPDHVADFMLDTTRGALGLMFSGTLDRYPNLTFILPHGGGFLPYIEARI